MRVSFRAAILLSTLFAILCFQPQKQDYLKQAVTYLKVVSKSIEGSSLVGIEATTLASKRTSARKYKDLSTKERTGYEYVQGGIEYDVPYIAEAKWYRILVRKNSESTICDTFSTDVETVCNKIFKGKVVDAFYPKSVLMKFKGRRESGKGLSITHKPMIPGLLFVKTAMSADIADDIESVSGVRGFVKDLHGLVVPLSEDEVSELDVLRAQEEPVMDEEVSKLRIGEYVSVVGGRHQGKYGIIEGTSNGKIEVRLRSEYRDSQDSIEVQHLRYLENPPEINYKDMTPKQAVESLLVKEPNGEMLRFLRKEGLLNQILHPERVGAQGGSSGDRSGSGRSWSSRGGSGDLDSARGREGGRSLRSIATKPPQEAPSAGSPRAGASKVNASPRTMDRADEDSLEAFLEAEEMRPATRSVPHNAAGPGGTAVAVRAAPAEPASATRSSNSRSARLEDFESFEEYLQALVAEDKQRAGNAGTGAASESANQKRPVGEEVDRGKGGTEDFATYTVTSLREMCRARGLATSGAKAQLLSRLTM